MRKQFEVRTRRLQTDILNLRQLPVVQIFLVGWYHAGL